MRCRGLVSLNVLLALMVRPLCVVTSLRNHPPKRWRAAASTKMMGLLDKVADVTKAGTAPGIDGWALEQQSLSWVVPYHDGAIRYYKEAGKWTDSAQAHNDGLIARQKVLQDAWAALEAEAPEDWDSAWVAARREALAAAGLPTVF